MSNLDSSDPCDVVSLWRDANSRRVRRRYESYLSHSDPVVLALNPFFVLEYASPSLESSVDLDVIS